MEGSIEQDLKTRPTPLDMLMELCRPCPFFYISIVSGGRIVKPECRLGKQQTCLHAAIVYLATTSNRESAPQALAKVAITAHAI